MHQCTDGLANRTAILESARTLYAQAGAGVPLATIAEHAGVSRTSISRHFPDRKALELALMDDDLRTVEAYAAHLKGAPDAQRHLFRFVLHAQFDSRALLPTDRHANTTDARALLQRMKTAFEHLTESHQAPLPKTTIPIEDVIVALYLSTAAVSPGTLDEPSRERAWRLLEKAVFGPPPD